MSASRDHEQTDGAGLEGGFTPGPWQERDNYDGRWIIIGNVDGEYFTDSAAPVMSYEFVASLEDEYGETHKNTAANRRLILAAPDLLAALQGVLRVADRKTDEFDAARAAIAKALGPSPPDQQVSQPIREDK